MFDDLEEKRAREGNSDFWICEEEVFETAKRLIAEHHPEAVNARICYMFRARHTKTNGKIRLGVCKKQPDQQVLLHGFEYIIELAHDMWCALEPNQQEALLLHEILHVFKDGEEETEWKIQPHDVEEFQKVIEVYGLWKPDLEELARTIDARRVEEQAA